MPVKNETIQLTIDDITTEGAGIGRHSGFAVFVPGALPGETVAAKIIKVTKSYAAARLMEIKEPSIHRCKPFCGIFEKCGGCTLQHLDYSEQLKYKSRHIKECMKRLGGIEIEEPLVLTADNIRDYRNKASFPVSEEGGR